MFCIYVPVDSRISAAVWCSDEGPVRCTGSSICSRRCGSGRRRAPFDRSIKLAVIVTIITVVVSLWPGSGLDALPRRHRRVLHDDRQPRRAGYPRASGLGKGLLVPGAGPEREHGAQPAFFLGAQLSWTLPFGSLRDIAVMSRFNHVWGGGGLRSSAPAAGSRSGW